MSNSSKAKNYGCGIFGAVFGRSPSRSVSTGSLPTHNLPNFPRTPSNSSSKRRKGPDDSSVDYSSSTNEIKKRTDRIVARPPPNQQTKAIPPSYVQPQPQKVRKSAADDKIAYGGQGIGRSAQQNYQSYGQNRTVPQGSTGISGELEAMIDDYQRSKGANNMKVYSNLGNLQQANSNKVDYQPTVNKKATKQPQKQATRTSFCRALSTRIDPEQLKIMGNEDYKNGRFAEALSLYEAAISIDPNKASYRSNKSAALTSLGRFLEAVFEAKEAIRIEPLYERAHNRLATLYLRLGDVDKTMYHYKQAGSEVDPDLAIKAERVQVHLNRCTEANKQRDWNTLLKETSLAISAGADSALQIYSLKAESLLKLHRHQETDLLLSNGPNFEVDDCSKFYGPISHANLLVIRAQVDLAAGRIDDAMEGAEIASKMDPKNKDVNMMVRRTSAVMGARSKGNELFKVAKYSEACIAYGEGLDQDPYNPVLLCNRAACRTKLGQFEKAIEDCTTALNIRPAYSKARLRRADCNTKLGNWQASIEDYEVLTRDTPEDEQVSKALKEAKEQLNRP